MHDTPAVLISAYLMYIGQDSAVSAGFLFDQMDEEIRQVRQVNVCVCLCVCVCVCVCVFFV